MKYFNDITNYFYKRDNSNEKETYSHSNKNDNKFDYNVEIKEELKLEDHKLSINYEYDSILYLIFKINSTENSFDIRIKTKVHFDNCKFYIDPLIDDEYNKISENIIKRIPNDFFKIPLSLIVDVQSSNKPKYSYIISTLYNNLYLFEPVDNDKKEHINLFKNLFYIISDSENEKRKRSDHKFYNEIKENKQNLYKTLKTFSNIFEIENIFKKMEYDKEFFQIIDNSNFNKCETYPSKLYVLKEFSSEFIEKLSSFRTKNRFPVLTYYYKKYKTFILRSSQTKNGIGILYGKSSKEDQEYLSRCQYKSDNNLNIKLKIYDARSWEAACANSVSFYFKIS